MKHIEEIRLENARRLASEFKTLSEFAGMIERSPTQVSRFMGKNPTKKIGSALARDIEDKLGLDSGYLDNEHDPAHPHSSGGEVDSSAASSKASNAANVAEGPSIKGSFPLISWVAAGAWSDISEIHPMEATYYPCPVNCSARTFVLKVQGISMEPMFRDGDLIFVDPEAEWRHGSYVVARINDDNEATFKQLVIEGGQKYLRPVNPNWPDQVIPINGNCCIVGTVVFTGRTL